ncbi:MAG: hypothetical protein LAT77_00455 [Aliidiomarina sp.]|uniref:hypothetical protein n=1 Tax=Aliidiomarina sp. TaxID=1872439 RepID=UPI0025BD3207|nr:hypothetical protein [Aliidiomarina sp.]MCH8500361.1 hypothetical protein [Aliidiomarina sp.]
MSKLDKDQVLTDFTAAYEKANGKPPEIVENNGWYSIDGGKNKRLAQLADEAKTLTGQAHSAPKKSAPKKNVASKKRTTETAKSAGLSAKALWMKRLEETRSYSRLPRGMQSER